MGFDVVSFIIAIIATVIVALPILFNIGFPKSDKKVVEVGDELEWFVSQINKSMREILIVAGEIHTKVYDNSAVLDALEHAYERGVSIHMIAGPEVVIPNDINKNIPLSEMEKTGKPILGLASRRIINLNIALNREPVHFTLIDSHTVYKEERHAPFQKNRIRTIITNSIFEASRLRREFKDYFIDTIPYPDAFELGIMKLEYELSPSPAELLK
jgi:hypothetical protein